MNEYYTKIEKKSPEKIIKSLEKECENLRNDLNPVNGEEEPGDVIWFFFGFLLNLISLLLKNMKEWLTI